MFALFYPHFESGFLNLSTADVGGLSFFAVGAVLLLGGC